MVKGEDITTVHTYILNSGIPGPSHQYCPDIYQMIGQQYSRAILSGLYDTTDKRCSGWMRKEI